MNENDVKKAQEMILRRDSITRQIEKLKDSTAVVGAKGRRIAAQLHFSSDSINIGLTQEIFDLIVTDMETQVELVNNQLGSMGVITFDEEVAIKSLELANRTSVPVTREPRSFKPVPENPIIPSVFVDQESKFAPKMPGQSGITTGNDSGLNSRVSDPDPEPPIDDGGEGAS